MKKLVYILFVISLVLNSCDNGAMKRQAEAKKAEKMRQDSINREKERVRLAIEDSIAIFAWGDAKFGMTKKEVLQTKSFSGSDRYDNRLSMNYEKEFAIEQAIGLRGRMKIWASFGGKSNNELSRISIENSYKWIEFDDLVFDVDRFIKEFTKKYGKPDDIQKNYLEMRPRDVDELKNIQIALWSIGSGNGDNGTKYIAVDVNKTFSDLYEYEYKISIYNTVFPKEKKQKSAAEIKAEQERAQIEKDAVENSF